MSDAKAGSIYGRGLPQQLQPAGSIRKRLGYVMPEGRDWRDVLDPQYWLGVVARLDAGDEIEVHDAARSVKFVVHVLAANEHAVPPRLDLGFPPIWPLDLALPEPTITEAPRYRLRQNARSEWEIIDSGGAIVASGLVDREAALRAMAAYDAAAEQTELATAVAIVALRQATPRTKPARPRGRPRKVASRPAADAPPPMAAASE